MNNTYSETIEKFKDIHVLVIGDIMLDTYLIGNTERICREAPVPIVDVQKKAEMPGGAANAAVNLAKLGATTYLVSIIGNDTEGKRLRQKLIDCGIYLSSLVIDEQRNTMIKTRIIAKDQTLLRFDIGHISPLSVVVEEMLIKKLSSLYSSVDAILLSDYGYGVINEHIRNITQSLQKKHKKILVIDAKHPQLYKDFPATAIKPNYKEALSLLGIQEDFLPEKRIEKMIAYREDFRQKVKSQFIAITLDTDGAVIIDNNNKYYQTHTTPQPDNRSAGAGDTYVSTLLLAFATGASMQDAVELAARSASITTQKSATAFCTNEELQNSYIDSTKVLETKEVYTRLANSVREKRKRIVFTNGCFDILHPGHVHYLNQAKSLGDVLIVGINTDSSIRRVKGKHRPINTLSDRIQVLSGLSSVDYIIPFAEDTPINIIDNIHPEIYVKGGDYTREILPEVPVVEQYGGRVELIPITPDKSTTNIIEKIHTQGGMNGIYKPSM